ncbi:MAG: hypothetical protein ABJA76_16290 [Mucilaginibacter sp.]
MLLFLPGVIGNIILSLPHSDLTAYQTHFAISNFLTTLNVTIVVIYQAYLVISFNKVSGVDSGFLKWNTWIPVIFTSIYLLYVIWGTFVKPVYHNPHYNAGPLRKSQLHGSALIILLFLLHAFITFYFINNQFVSRKIKLITDEVKQEKLKVGFLIALKRLTKISIWVIGGLILMGLVMDMINFS